MSEPTEADKQSEDELIEKLAAIEHQRWADWQKWVHSTSRGIYTKEGPSLVLPAVYVGRWERQIATPYADLSEKEKQSDRDQVMRYWPLIKELVQQREREARIDELKGIPLDNRGNGGVWLTMSLEERDRRINALQEREVKNG